MKTFTKVLLLVFWLLGAGVGLTVPESPQTDGQGQYRYALAEGVDVSVQRQHVTVHIEHRAMPRSFALTVAVPAWVTALSHRPEHALTASSKTPPSGGNS
jgi:hypothetical protein